MRILVTPERLDDLSRQMTQAANELRDLEGRLGRALGSLDWEARQQANVEAQVHAARRQAQNLAGEAEGLARFLTDCAAAFRQADAQGAESLGATTQAYLRSLPPSPLPVPTPLPQAHEAQAYLHLGDWLTPVERALDFAVPAAVLYLGLRMVVDGQGIAHVFGPQWLREWAGLSTNLTRIRPEHLARHWLGEELRLSFSPLANLQTALGLIPTVIKDYRTYSGQGGAAFVSAVLVDGAISIVTSKVFQLVGAATGTLLTPVLGLLGPVAGYAVGGMFGSYAEDWLRQTSAAQGLRNGARQGLEQVEEWVTNLTRSALNAVARPVL